MTQGEVRHGEARDGWDPAQYGKFAEERAQPFWDLVSLIKVPAQGLGRCVDLGCGTGVLTAAVTERLGIDEMVGIESSDAMLDAARAAIGWGDERLRFARGDLGKWTSRGDHDLVLANASLQWVPDHPGVLARWWGALSPGGQLAVQVPANADHPAHVIASQVAVTEPYLSAFNSLPPPDPVAHNVLAPEHYSVVLNDLGAVDQHVRLQVYAHHLESTASVVEWIRGTSLTRFTKLLTPELCEQFIEAIRTRVLDTLGDVSPYFYPFKRILVWGRKAPA
jgi:trans-aconitate 2-methyltransferase